jgi:predicted RNase H-like HicB family nuclease
VAVRPNYDAFAARRGRWWAVEVPAVPGLHPQARRLDQVEAVAREAIATALDLQEQSFDVAVEPQLASLGDLGTIVEAALKAREAAEVAQAKAAAATRNAVHALRSAGYSSRDAGMLLGVSNQRISQIEHAQGTTRSPET